MKKILALALLGSLLLASCGLAGIPMPKLEGKQIQADTTSKAPVIIEAGQDIDKEILEVEMNTPTRKELTPIIPWPIFWWWLNIGDSTYYLMSGQTGVEYGINLFANFSLIGFGFHHVELIASYLPFGKDVDPGLHVIPFEEDVFIFLFLHRNYIIKIPYADMAIVDLFLYVDGEIIDTSHAEIG